MKKRVLFVCIHNSARSQMAEAFLNQLCGDTFEAHSAGIEPGKLNPIVVQAMHELGRLYLNKKCGADPVSAFQWFTTAARFGLPESKAEAAKLALTLSAAQRKSAQLAVDGWIRQHPGSQKEEDEEDEGR